jgi:hypothetical protein
MKSALAAAFGLALMAVVPAVQPAIGSTLNVEIYSADLRTPVEIIDPTVGPISVSVGQGLNVTAIEQTVGFTIDWLVGTVAHRPSGRQHFEVFFFSDFRKKDGSVIYAISYDYDPSTQKGLVYLPGIDDNLFPFNQSWIARRRNLNGYDLRNQDRPPLAGRGVIHTSFPRSGP